MAPPAASLVGVYGFDLARNAAVEPPVFSMAVRMPLGSALFGTLRFVIRRLSCPSCHMDTSLPFLCIAEVSY